MYVLHTERYRFVSQVFGVFDRLASRLKQNDDARGIRSEQEHSRQKQCERGQSYGQRVYVRRQACTMKP